MTNEAILEKMQDIFRNVLDRTDLVLQRETSAENVEGWDSLAHVNLVIALEKSFKIRFTLGELQPLRNVGDMVDLIGRKTAGIS